MPNCFSLYPLAGGDAVSLTAVDEEVCALMGMEISSEQYCRNWFDIIGLLIAVKGVDLHAPMAVWVAEFDKFYGPKKERRDGMLKVLAFLRSKYKSSAWAEIGR